MRLKDGSVFDLYYREVLGTVFLIDGSFEEAEIELLKRHTRAKAWLFDVGANVGCLTIPAALSEPLAQFMAIEPLRANVDRLRAHVALNGVHNVEVVEAAAADVEGTTSFVPATDPALGTTTEISASEDAITVRCTTIDDLWTRAGRPEVSLLKVDVEGGELRVLRGAHMVMRHCSPVLLIEANTAAALNELILELRQFGYVRQPFPGLQPWNYLFERVGQRAEAV
jgi:FkbM family methyltransferase